MAATKAAQALSHACIKMCVEGSGKSNEASLKVVLPALVKGLSSSVAEVRGIVVTTVVKLTKGAGAAMLRPHLSALIPALLEAASDAESTEISYVSVRVSNDPEIQEKLDLARVTAAKVSPLMESVNSVLAFVDGAVLESLIPRLVELIRGHYGLVTKGCAAHVVATLTHQEWNSQS